MLDTEPIRPGQSAWTRFGNVRLERLGPLIRRCMSPMVVVCLVLLMMMVAGDLWAGNERSAWVVGGGERSNWKVGYIRYVIVIRSVTFEGSDEAFKYYDDNIPGGWSWTNSAGVFEISNHFNGFGSPGTWTLMKPEISSYSGSVQHSICKHAAGIPCILDGATYRSRFCRAPLWIPALLLIGIMFISGHRRFRRTRPGCCWRCGYMLIGLVSGKCPECNWMIVDAVKEELQLRESNQTSGAK